MATRIDVKFTRIKIHVKVDFSLSVLFLILKFYFSDLSSGIEDTFCENFLTDYNCINKIGIQVLIVIKLLFIEVYFIKCEKSQYLINFNVINQLCENLTHNNNTFSDSITIPKNKFMRSNDQCSYILSFN